TKTELVTKQNYLSEIERYERKLRNDYDDYIKITDLVEKSEEVAYRQRELREKKKILDGFEFYEVKESIDTLQVIEEQINKMKKNKKKQKKRKNEEKRKKY